MRSNRVLMAAVSMLLLTGGKGFAHCQIPCGIYDDATRFALMNEHVTTLEKSMKQIVELSKDPAANANQLIRWVTNKDDHADQLTEIVTFYFLAQRVKAPAKDAGEEAQQSYLKKLELLHGVIVGAMKAKQTTDLTQIETLRTLIYDFETLYMGAQAHSH